jgi:glycosyltransferase involved in cell wall biosynthesis
MKESVSLKKLEISIVINSFNSEKTIARVIEAVREQSYSPNELIVVDGGSSDRTIEALNEIGVRYYQQEENKGLSADRNLGIRKARSEHIAFLDADAVPDKDWLRLLAEEIALELSRGAKIGGAGGALVEMYRESLPDRWKAAHLLQNDYGSKKYVPALAGSNCLFPKKALIEAGLYDESLFLGGEDMRITHNLVVRGYKLKYVPEAKVMHLHSYKSIRSVIKTAHNSFSADRFSNIWVLAKKLVFALVYTPLYFFKDLLKGRFDILLVDLLFTPYIILFHIEKYKKERAKIYNG